MANTPQEIKGVADLHLAADPITVRDKTVRIGMDKSPQRRRKVLRTYYQAREDIGMISSYPFTYCDRALEIWCKDGAWKIGSYDRLKEEWKWYEGHVREAGVKTPNSTAQDEDNTEGAAVPAERGAGPSTGAGCGHGAARSPRLVMGLAEPPRPPDDDLEHRAGRPQQLLQRH